MGALYRTHVNDLISYAMCLGFDKDTSMDAVHDVFCKVIADKELTVRIRDIRTYLFRAVKNRLLDISKTCHETPMPVEEMPFNIQASVEDEFIDNEDSELLRSKVERLLATLTDRQREIIYLRYEENLDYEEISGLMKISEPSCRKLIHKIISALKKQTHFIFI